MIMGNWKKVKLENPDWKCPKCGSHEVEYRISEHDDYDDIHYICPDCKKNWWSEGSDY